MPILIIKNKNPPLGLQKKHNNLATKKRNRNSQLVFLVAAAATFVVLLLAGRSEEGVHVTRGVKERKKKSVHS